MHREIGDKDTCEQCGKPITLHSTGYWKHDDGMSRHPVLPSTAPKEPLRYTQGVCGDGAAILKDGVRMTIEEILAELNNPMVLRASERPSEVRIDFPSRSASKEFLEQLEAHKEDIARLVKEAYARLGVDSLK